MVLPLTTRLRSWRHNAWLVGNESRRSASRSPAQRAGGQHSTNKNLFPIRVLVTTLATTHSINQLLLLTSLQKHCVQWQHHHRCCFSLNQLNDVVPNFEKARSPNFGRNSTVSCYRQATTGKLAVEWTLMCHAYSEIESTQKGLSLPISFNCICLKIIIKENYWQNLSN